MKVYYRTSLRLEELRILRYRQWHIIYLAGYPPPSSVCSVDPESSDPGRPCRPLLNDPRPSEETEGVADGGSNFTSSS